VGEVQSTPPSHQKFAPDRRHSVKNTHGISRRPQHIRRHQPGRTRAYHRDHRLLLLTADPIWYQMRERGSICSNTIHTISLVLKITPLTRHFQPLPPGALPTACFCHNRLLFDAVATAHFQLS
jgi:hypothetical protein